MKPYTRNWQEMKKRALLLKLDHAMGEKKVEYGIRQVWRATNQKNGQLLLVEKNFMYPAYQGAEPGSISREDFSLTVLFTSKTPSTM